jgi:hypothetical protein
MLMAQPLEVVMLVLPLVDGVHANIQCYCGILLKVVKKLPTFNGSNEKALEVV